MHHTYYIIVVVRDSSSHGDIRRSANSMPVVAREIGAFVFCVNTNVTCIGCLVSCVYWSRSLGKIDIAIAGR